MSVPFAQAYTALESGQVDISLFIEPFYSNTNSLLSGGDEDDEANQDRDALPDDLTIMMVSGFGHAD